jgi:hypothetical protein
MTVDRFNEALLFNYPWEKEISGIVEWVSGRLGQAGGYAGSFALTDFDWKNDFRLFTGERVTTRAARAHIMAEETSRMIRLIQNKIGSSIEALKESDTLLGTRIFHLEKSSAISNGFYCCGKCSVAFWRYLAIGGFVENGSSLAAGMKSLSQARDGKGGWKRFPYYYTLLCLGELDSSLVQDEITYVSKRFDRILPILSRRQDIYSLRRREIICRLRDRLRVN